MTSLLCMVLGREFIDIWECGSLAVVFECLERELIPSAFQTVYKTDSFCVSPILKFRLGSLTVVFPNINKRAQLNCGLEYINNIS